MTCLRPCIKTIVYDGPKLRCPKKNVESQIIDIIICFAVGNK